MDAGGVALAGAVAPGGVAGAHDDGVGELGGGHGGEEGALRGRGRWRAVGEDVLGGEEVELGALGRLAGWAMAEEGEASEGWTPLLWPM